MDAERLEIALHARQQVAVIGLMLALGGGGAARTARKTRLCAVFSGMNGRRGRRADREMAAAK